MTALTKFNRQISEGSLVTKSNASTEPIIPGRTTGSEWYFINSIRHPVWFFMTKKSGISGRVEINDDGTFAAGLLSHPPTSPVPVPVEKNFHDLENAMAWVEETWLKEQGP